MDESIGTHLNHSTPVIHFQQCIKSSHVNQVMQSACTNICERVDPSTGLSVQFKHTVKFISCYRHSKCKHLGTFGSVFSAEANSA